MSNTGTRAKGERAFFAHGNTKTLEKRSLCDESEGRHRKLRVRRTYKLAFYKGFFSIGDENFSHLWIYDMLRMRLAIFRWGRGRENGHIHGDIRSSSRSFLLVRPRERTTDVRRLSCGGIGVSHGMKKKRGVSRNIAVPLGRLLPRV